MITVNELLYPKERRIPTRYVLCHHISQSFKAMHRKPKTLPYLCLGLSRVLILESSKRMCERGARHATIASVTQDPIVSHLYALLNPIETYWGYHWDKQPG